MGPRLRGDDRLRVVRSLRPLPLSRLCLALDARTGEIRPGLGRDARAELVAQGARPHLLDRAHRELAELEWPERQADQAVDRKPEVPEHVSHLADLALADRQGGAGRAHLDAVAR